MELLDQLVKEFQENTKEIWKDGEPLVCALREAHADMSRRARGHTPKVQEASVDWLKAHFEKNSPFEQGDFNTWHEKTCQEYCDHMNGQKLGFVITKGRAQKVLNMTFKYLYCNEKYRAEVEKIAPNLHMVLDGYTMAWYKEVVLPSCKEKLKVGDVSDWSKMDEPGRHTYAEIQTRIGEYIRTHKDYCYTIHLKSAQEGNKKKESVTVTVPVGLQGERNCPFFWEFIVWDGENIRSRMRELLSGLNSLREAWATDQWATDAQLRSALRTRLEALAGCMDNT